MNNTSLSKVWFAATRGASNWLWLSAFAVLLDQTTKALVVGAVKFKSPIELLPFLRIVYLENEGAAFSLLHDAGGWQRWFFIALALLVSVVLMLWLRRIRIPGQTVLAIGVSLVLGGALGNVIDRVWHSYVIDFVYFHWQDWYFPAFNIADAAISVGAGCLLLDALWESGRDDKKAKDKV